MGQSPGHGNSGADLREEFCLDLAVEGQKANSVLFCSDLLEGNCLNSTHTGKVGRAKGMAD